MNKPTFWQRLVFGATCSFVIFIALCVTKTLYFWECGYSFGGIFFSFIISTFSSTIATYIPDIIDRRK